MLVVVVARVLRRAAVECSGGRVVGRKEVVMVDWSANRMSPFKMLIYKFIVFFFSCFSNPYLMSCQLFISFVGVAVLSRASPWKRTQHSST